MRGGGQCIHKELVCLGSIHFNVVKYSCVINPNLRVHGAETDKCKCREICRKETSEGCKKQQFSTDTSRLKLQH